MGLSCVSRLLFLSASGCAVIARQAVAFYVRGELQFAAGLAAGSDDG